MKKTTFILGLSLSAILAIAGCANNTTNDQAVIDKLSMGLDHVTNAVSSVSVSSAYELTRDNFENSQNLTSQTTYSGAGQSTSAVAKIIESNRYQILRKAKNIKRKIASGELKLGNKNAQAISELTDSLQKYSTELARTKSDYRNTVRSMSKLENADTKYNAKLNRLSCCLESRDCYMNNILNSLNNVESILNALENGSDQNNSSSQNNSSNQNSTSKDWGNKTPDDYADSNGEQNFDAGRIYTQNYDANCPNGNCYPNTYCPDGNCYPNAYCPDGNCYNTGYNAQYSGVGGYNYNRGIFNPNRNTDTYGPGVTNIDTYRNYGNGYGYGQGVRHFNGSNGVNSVMPSYNREQENSEILDAGASETGKTNIENSQNIEEKKEKDEEKITTDNGDEKIISTKTAEEKDVKKTISSSKNADTRPAKPHPHKAETMQKETDGKIKAVTAEKAEEKKPIKSDDEKIVGEDKVKGHTSTAQADINKDIKELLK